MDCFEDVVHRFHKGLDQLIGADADGLRQTVCQIAALDLFDSHIRALHDAADVLFQLFCRSEADEHVVFLSHVLYNRFVETAAGRLDGFAFHYAAGRDHGDLRSSSADVDDHVTIRLADVDAGAQRGRDSLFQQVDLSRSGFDSRIDHRALFHAADAAGNAAEHTGLEETEGGDAADQLPLHLCRHLIV